MECMNSPIHELQTDRVADSSNTLGRNIGDAVDSIRATTDDNVVITQVGKSPTPAVSEDIRGAAGLLRDDAASAVQRAERAARDRTAHLRNDVAEAEREAEGLLSTVSHKVQDVASAVTSRVASVAGSVRNAVVGGEQAVENAAAEGIEKVENAADRIGEAARDLKDRVETDTSHFFSRVTHGHDVPSAASSRADNEAGRVRHAVVCDEHSSNRRVLNDAATNARRVVDSRVVDTRNMHNAHLHRDPVALSVPDSEVLFATDTSDGLAEAGSALQRGLIAAVRPSAQGRRLDNGLEREGIVDFDALHNRVPIAHTGTHATIHTDTRLGGTSPTYAVPQPPRSREWSRERERESPVHRDFGDAAIPKVPADTRSITQRVGDALHDVKDRLFGQTHQIHVMRTDAQELFDDAHTAAADAKRLAEAQLQDAKRTVDKLAAELRTAEVRSGEAKRALQGRATEAKRAVDSRTAELHNAEARAAEATRALESRLTDAKRAVETRAAKLRAAEARAADATRALEGRSAEAERLIDARANELHSAESRAAQVQQSLDDARRAEEAKRQEHARRAAEAKEANRLREAKIADDARRAEIEANRLADAKRMEAERRADEAKRGEEVKRVEAARIAAAHAEEARRRADAAAAADVKRTAEAKRIADAEAKARAAAAETQRKAELAEQKLRADAAELKRRTEVGAQRRFEADQAVTSTIRTNAPASPVVGQHADGSIHHPHQGGASWAFEQSKTTTDTSRPFFAAPQTHTESFSRPLPDLGVETLSALDIAGAGLHSAPQQAAAQQGELRRAEVAAPRAELSRIERKEVPKASEIPADSKPQQAHQDISRADLQQQQQRVEVAKFDERIASPTRAQQSTLSRPMDTSATTA